MELCYVQHGAVGKLVEKKKLFDYHFSISSMFSDMKG